MSSVLENEIKTLEAEISKLNTKVTSLQDEKRNLEAKIREEKSKNSQITKIQYENRNLLDLIKEKDQKMDSLENEIISLKKENKSIKREIEKKYENEIGYYKNLNETNTTKVDNANIILKLNERQHEAILKLEDKIDEIKRADAEYQKQMQIKHENQFTNLKRKMMDHIKNAQKNMAQSNLDNLDLNTKISKLTTNQLLIELEEQSYQIEDLLKEREKNKKEIFALKTELNTHKKVEHILQEKNKRYLDMVKACDKKIEKSKKNNTNNNNSDDYDLIINDDNENMTNNNNFQNFKKFEKMYTKLFKDYQNLKGVYESLRDRERSQQQKFEGIINLYKMVIDDLVNDEEFRNKKDIYVNIEEIKKGNFENFTKEEKYSILVYLMKHLLPLVNSENNEINSFKEKIDSVEINGNNKFMSKTTYGDFYGVKNRNLFNKNENRLNTIGNFEKRAISSINDKNNKNRTFTKFPKIESLFADNNIKQKNKDTKILFRFLNIPNN